jgi:DNA repair protein RadC
MKVRLSEKDKILIKDSEDIYGIMKRVLKRENKLSRRQERFWLVGLDNKQSLQFIELVALGKFNVVSIEPVELFHLAVLKQCKSLILVHSHPDGDVTASEKDIESTEYLYVAARVLKIKLVDHLVISETTYYSFLKKGKMKFGV